MGELSYSTGKKSYTLPGGNTISFDPSDMEFSSKIVAAFRNCYDIQNKGMSKQFTDIDEMLSTTQKVAADIKEEINKAFGESVCDKAFCGSGPISISDGLPVWMNFLMAVIDEIDANMPDGEKRSRERVQHYFDKYESKYGKYARK